MCDLQGTLFIGDIVYWFLALLGTCQLVGHRGAVLGNFTIFCVNTSKRRPPAAAPAQQADAVQDIATDQKLDLELHISA